MTAAGLCHCGCGEATSIAPQTRTDRGWVRGEPMPFRPRHRRIAPFSERFWAKVRMTHTCWIWTGAQTFGYGVVSRDGQNQRAHRVAYELLVGPVPDGLVLDHLCRNPSCVNPAHLEPVTQAENTRRGVSRNREKTHCPAGHPYDAGNLYVAPGGGRFCIACRRETDRRRDARRAPRRRSR